MELSFHAAARRVSAVRRLQLHDVLHRKALAGEGAGHGGVSQLNGGLFDHHRTSGLDQNHFLVGNRFPVCKQIVVQE